MDFYIWQDHLDANTYLIGEKSSGTKVAGYVAWGTVFTDGVDDMFGKEVREAADAARPNAVHIVGTFEIK